MIDASCALRIAYENGVVASVLSGKMLHTTVPSSQLSQLPAQELHLAAVNHGIGDRTVLSVTLCGTDEAVAAWVTNDESAIVLKPEAPWHHAAYAATDAIAQWGAAGGGAPLTPSWTCASGDAAAAGGGGAIFVSSVTARHETALDAAHWHKWLTQPVQFDAAMVRLVALLASGASKEAPVYVVQMGAHPVLDGAVDCLHGLLEAAGMPLLAAVSSMRRQVSAAAHLRAQRALLDHAGLLRPQLTASLLASGALEMPVKGAGGGSEAVVLSASKTFAEQGVKSASIPMLSRRLAPYFPGLAPHDLYRHTSVDALLSSFDSGHDETSQEARGATAIEAGESMGVLGWGLRLPASVTSGEELWSHLVEERCAISSPPAAFEHCKHQAGYLHPPFDSKTASKAAVEAGVEPAEASVLDPQHALAIDLVKRALEDAGNEATALALADRERIGVYIGVWQPPADDAQRKSAYSAIGGSLSALAARVANCFDLHGPAITINTACSSGLVAVDTAMRDLRAGRIDYALVGGVNLIATSPKAADSFAALARATMLSPTARCHTFSAAADGYVRAEGGVVFLLQSSAVTSAPPPRAVIVGSAVNQNTQRKPMTAVDPIAQERVVRAACRDAGIAPSDLAAIEMHGTGTKLGDPTEISALARVTAQGPGDGADVAATRASGGCTLTAAKMVSAECRARNAERRMPRGHAKTRRERTRAIPTFCAPAPTCELRQELTARLALLSHLCIRVIRPPPLSPTHPCARLLHPQHFGHLESAAGALGLLKACLMLTKRTVPSFAIDCPGINPALEPLLASSRLALPDAGTGTALPEGAFVGVSSFGFAGNNAHVVLKMAGAHSPAATAVAAHAEVSPNVTVVKSLSPPPAEGAILETADAKALRLHGGDGEAQATGTEQPLRSSNAGTVPPTSDAAAAACAAVWKATCDIVGNEDAPVDEHASLFDLGIDSLGLAELVIQLEECYGEGCVTIDDVIANPIVKHIAAKLASGASADEAASPPLPKPATAVALPPAPAAPVAPAATAVKVSPPSMRTPPPTPTPTRVTSMMSPSHTESPLVMARLDKLESLVTNLAEAVKVLTPLAQTALQRVVEPTSVGETPSVASMLESAAAGSPAADEEMLCQLVAPEESLIVSPAPPSPTADWIETTHVGSLPRPTASGELSAKSIIDMQRAAGLSVVNDGEWSRDNYIADMLSRISGVGSGGDAHGKGGATAPSCLCEMPCAADMRAVPTYAQRFTGGNGLITLNPKRVARADTACTAMPRYLSTSGLHVTLTPFLEGLNEAGVPLDKAFWTVPSPGTLAVFCEDRFFGGDHTAYVDALANAVRPEYEAIARTGVKLQIGASGASNILTRRSSPAPARDPSTSPSHLNRCLLRAAPPTDCPDLAMGRHTRYVHLSDAEFAAVAEANVRALNSALINISKEQVRIHICWGNYAGPHHLDLNAYSVWPHVANVHCKYVLIEGANPRHGHEAVAFEQAVAAGLIDPTELVVVPGVIDTTAARVEHPHLVAERLLRFVRATGHPSRVMASTDCGFASTARSVAITADLAWRKIEALVEGAALATKIYLEAQAPVPMKGPMLAPTPYRVALVCAGAPDKVTTHALIEALGERTSSVDVFSFHTPTDAIGAAAAAAFESLRFAVDFPIALVAVGDSPAQLAAAQAAVRAAAGQLRTERAVSRRPTTCFVVGAGARVTGGELYAGDGSSPAAIAQLITSRMLDTTGFDRRVLAPGLNPSPLPTETEVVVVGGGLLGMVAAHRLRAKGHAVVILEQRALIGGIWSMHANSTSQVNSSEGGYCLKEFLPSDSPRKTAENRDHSTAAEVLSDLAEFGDSLKEVTHTQVQVVQILGTNGDYHVVCQQHGAGADLSGGAFTKVIKCAGVVLAINDRVGMPRSLQVPGMDKFRGVMADGTSDLLTGVDWRGKRVVIFGMGAFAVENVRTALEGGASHVTVVARRLGTVCPKMIDYLNFVKPWDEHYRHETSTNVKQLKCWRDTYTKSGAATPECWPSKIKHDGHTISVSDIWFVAHHMGKMRTHIGALEAMDADGCVLSDGTHLPCDIVVGCIGFERNTTFCEQLTRRSDVFHSNYLDKNMIYLADAEIDESAFNSFFGSSVLEYAKFYTNVYVEGLERPDQLGPLLWGPNVAKCPVKLRKWTQYIGVGAKLIDHDAACAAHAAQLVNDRTKHFYRTMPPTSFVEVNRKEWEELHTRLNGGVPVPKNHQLPYAFGAAADWCLPTAEVLA